MEPDYHLYLIIILLVLFIIIGLFGNIISIFIFNYQEFHKQQSVFYLINSCIINIIIILYLPIATLPTIWTISDLACKLLSGIMYILIQTQSFIIAYCSMDRLITLMSPFKCLFKNKIKFQVLTTLITILIMTIFVIPMEYFYQRQITIQNLTICGFTNEVTWNLTYLKIELFLLRTMIPFAIMIISSTLILWNIKKYKLKFGSINIKQTAEYQLSITLVTMDILFVIFRLPSLIFATSSEDDNFIFSFTYSMFILIGAFHNVFYFLIFIFFNRVYRCLFFKLMKKIKISLCKVNNQVSHNNNSLVV